MADEKKAKGDKATDKADKGAKSDKAPKAEKAAKSDKAPKAPKAEKSEKAAKGSAGKASRSGRGGEGTSRGAVSAERPKGAAGKPRMKKHYEDQVRPELMKKFGYTNVMQAPQFQKIVVNMGVATRCWTRSCSRPLRTSSARSPASARPCAARRSRSRTSSCAKAWPWAAPSRCAARACTSSTTG